MQLNCVKLSMTMNDIISSSSPSSRHEKKDVIAMSAKGTKQSVVKFKKAPEAPKNPKTAFFFFSMHMHEEKKRGISGVLDISKTIPDAAKQISAAWKALSQEEKKKWEEKAEKDKLRYKVEKSIYLGPLTVVKGEKRARKDSEAPKRPMSAFLDYSKTLRSQAIKDNPHVTDNKEISKCLGSMWRNATVEEKQPFIEKEKLLRDQYNEKTRVYKKNKKDQQVAERSSREAKVMDAIENGTHDQLIQSAEESRRNASTLKMLPENIADTFNGHLWSDRMDPSFAAARCHSQSSSDHLLARQHQPHTSGHRSYGEQYYNSEDSAVPVFYAEHAYMPHYENIPRSAGAFNGVALVWHSNQDGYYATGEADAEQWHHHHFLQEEPNVPISHGREFHNFPIYDSEPGYEGAPDNNWHCHQRTSQQNSTQVEIFSPLSNERIANGDRASNSGFACHSISFPSRYL